MLIKEYGKAKARLLKPLGLEPAHDPHSGTNGEYDLLRFIRSIPEVAGYDSVIDVGANVGNWTAEAASQFKGTNIENFYCVEPIADFVQALRARFARNRDVRILETALSAESGQTVQVFNVGGGGRMYPTYRGGPIPATSGEHRPAEKAEKAVIPHAVVTSTGDELFGERTARPYLIKIDCDGHDCHVLRGCKRLIQKARPLIQFEYCDFWIGAQSRLGDACRLLYEADYRTFKIFPDRLVRFRYNALFETFGYQNILATPAEFASFADRSVALPGNTRGCVAA